MSPQLNVLLVVLDGVRADRLSCAGYERETTPFVDQVAREGVRFANAVTTAPSLLSAQASIMTGLFPSVHGATDEHRSLSGEVRLLPEYLKAAGYRTAAFCTVPAVSPEGGFGRGFDRFHTQRAGGRLTRRAAQYARSASDRVLGRSDAGARRTTRALLDWIGDGEAPFFAFVHYRENELPVHPPAPYDRLFLPGASAAHVRNASQKLAEAVARGASLGPEEIATLQALYDGALRYVDVRLKEVADALVARRMWERTLFVLTAAYGTSLGEHDIVGYQGVLYDTVVRVPLILRCPTRVARGFVVDAPAQPTDLLPTIAALLGTGVLESPVQGRALLADGEPTAGPVAAVIEAFRPEPVPVARRIGGVEPRRGGVRQKAIRTRREKYIWRSDEDNEYYDLVRDPLEQDNRIVGAADRAETMRRALFDWLASGERLIAEPHGAESEPRPLLQRLGTAE